MCTDKATKHLQDKQGANVALHATTGTTQDTWSTVQQRLEDMTETLKKLLTRVPETHVEKHSRPQAGDFQGQTLGASAGNLRRNPQTSNEAAHTANTTVVDTVTVLPVDSTGNDFAAINNTKAALLVTAVARNDGQRQG